MINREYLNNLNEAQKEAVMHLDGPLLIVAGAGSGKTKVLTSRIANIIKEKKAFPNQILAVTFTNKAAKEMQNRVSKILGSAAVGLSWLGTFHSICAKLLRKHASAAQLNSNFTIIDTDDQIRLIKNICKAENIDIKQLSPRFILAIIDRWKNKGFYPGEVIINKKDIYEKTVLPLYKIYQQKLTDLNSCDFGDLILHTVKILEFNPDIREIIYSFPEKMTMILFEGGKYYHGNSILTENNDCENRTLLVLNIWEETPPLCVPYVSYEILQKYLELSLYKNFENVNIQTSLKDICNKLQQITNYCSFTSYEEPGVKILLPEESSITSKMFDDYVNNNTKPISQSMTILHNAIERILSIKNLSSKKLSFRFSFGDFLFIIYTNKVHGAPTKPMVFLSFKLGLELTFFIALYT